MSADAKSVEAQAEKPVPIPPEPSPASPAPIAADTPNDRQPAAQDAPGEDVPGEDVNGDPPEGADANGYASNYYTPYASVLPPAVQWDPTYGSSTYQYPIVQGDEASPAVAGGSDPDGAQAWNPNAPYSPAEPIPVGESAPYTGGVTTAIPAYSQEYIAGAPMSYAAEPVVDYGAYLNATAPPGMMAPPEMPVMRDEALEARVTALEWHAYELASRARDAEIDLLMHKVASVEEMIMRFLSEIPIRLGGEIGVLERRVTYLSEELPVRLQTESGASAEHIERLSQKVAALERFAQSVPSARWYQDQHTRSEALERRIVELEQFCTALARKGTGPREVAASTAEDTGSPSGPSGPSGSNGIPRASSRGAQAREVDRRRPRQ